VIMGSGMKNKIIYGITIGAIGVMLASIG